MSDAMQAMQNTTLNCWIITNYKFILLWKASHENVVYTCPVGFYSSPVFTEMHAEPVCAN